MRPALQAPKQQTSLMACSSSAPLTILPTSLAPPRRLLLIDKQQALIPTMWVTSFQHPPKCTHINSNNSGSSCSNSSRSNSISSNSSRFVGFSSLACCRPLQCIILLQMNRFRQESHLLLGRLTLRNKVAKSLQSWQLAPTAAFDHRVAIHSDIHRTSRSALIDHWLRSNIFVGAHSRGGLVSLQHTALQACDQPTQAYSWLTRYGHNTAIVLAVK
jgi:hypothetical protein